MCGHTFGTPSERHAVRLKAFFPEVFVGVTGYPTATSPIPFTPAPTALATPTSTATAPQDATLANSRTARSGGHELAAVAAWILAGGDQAGLPAPLSDWCPPTTPIDAGAEGSAPVQVESTPSGAEVRIDGIRRGQTPAVLGLSPGTHVLKLRHPNAIETVWSIDVPAQATDLAVSLWRRQPDILPLRPVYPGANLADARFVSDGTVALSVSLPGGNSEALPASARELWQLDPVTGSLARLALTDPSAQGTPLIALAPDGEQVAYLVQGSAVSASLWPATGSTAVRDRRTGRRRSG